MNKADMVLSAIRSVGASFPGASTLVNAWNEHSTNMQIEKCRVMIESLAKELDEIKQDISRKESDCSQVFELGLRNCINDPDIGKAPLYATIIAQFCDGTTEKDTAMNLIYEAETLLEYDFEVLRKITGGRIDSTFGFRGQTDRFLVSKCQASIKKLEGKGLVGRGGNNTMSLERIYDQDQEWPFTFYQEYYMILHQGKALLNALERQVHPRVP